MNVFLNKKGRRLWIAPQYIRTKGSVSYLYFPHFLDTQAACLVNNFNEFRKPLRNYEFNVLHEKNDSLHLNLAKDYSICSRSDLVLYDLAYCC